LTLLALGRELPAGEPRATVLAGSRIVICGGGGNHRTLACFLWGDAPLGGRVTVVDDTPDDELHAACRLIDSRLPDPGDGLHPSRVTAASRGELLELAHRLEPLPALTVEDLRAAEAEMERVRFRDERPVATLRNVRGAVKRAEDAAAAAASAPVRGRRRRLWWRS